uniref:Aspartate aminotransferase, mitochondrial n=1 Tax=Macrostomum lignano TaxID=282301 RepID=A0A1I8FJ22_9PLAT
NTPIVGLPEFTKAAVELALGSANPILSEGRNASAQSISGTGALRIGAPSLPNSIPAKTVWFPRSPPGEITTPCSATPALPLFRSGHVRLRRRRLPLTTSSKIPEGDVILLHALRARNPTGGGSAPGAVAANCATSSKRKGSLYPSLTWPNQRLRLRLRGHGRLGCQALPIGGPACCPVPELRKNMGLYGERVGAFSIFCDSQEGTRPRTEPDEDPDPAKCTPIRPIAAAVLTQPELRQAWLSDVKGMADRIIGCERQLTELLAKEGSKKNWQHIIDQIGMFCFTGLKPEQVERLIKEFSHLPDQGWPDQRGAGIFVQQCGLPGPRYSPGYQVDRL